MLGMVSSTWSGLENYLQREGLGTISKVLAQLTSKLANTFSTVENINLIIMH